MAKAPQEGRGSAKSSSPSAPWALPRGIHKLRVSGQLQASGELSHRPSPQCQEPGCLQLPPPRPQGAAPPAPLSGAEVAVESSGPSMHRCLVPGAARTGPFIAVHRGSRGLHQPQRGGCWAGLVWPLAPAPAPLLPCSEHLHGSQCCSRPTRCSWAKPPSHASELTCPTESPLQHSRTCPPDNAGQIPPGTHPSLGLPGGAAPPSWEGRATKGSSTLGPPVSQSSNGRERGLPQSGSWCKGVAA